MPNPHLLLLNCRLHTQTIWCVKIGFGSHRMVAVLFKFYGLFLLSLSLTFGCHVEPQPNEERPRRKWEKNRCTYTTKPTYTHTQAHTSIEIYTYCPDVLCADSILFFWYFVPQWIVPLLKRMNLCASVCARVRSRVCGMRVHKCCAQQVEHYEPYYMCFVLIIF